MNILSTNVILKTHFRCIVAPYEADSQLAFLSRNNIVDAILTEDSDLFIFEANTESLQINRLMA